MKQIFVVFTALLMPLAVFCQTGYNLSGTRIEFKSGMEVNITIKVNGIRHYLDGLTCSQSLKLRTTTTNFNGTRWRMYEYANCPSVFRIQSQGGCNTNWLDGKTRSGTLTLRDQTYSNNKSLTGTRWKVYHLNNGNFAIECLGTGTSNNTRWLCYKDGKIVLLNDYKVYGSGWNFIVK